jgi:Predicted membrane protein (DUF2232)
VAADAARPGRWALLLTALAAFLLVPATPVVQSIAPVRDAPWLLVTALAVCTVVGWGAGGRGWLAVMWVALAIGVLVVSPVVRPTYLGLERGWAVLLAAAFGLVCETSPLTVRFFPRALTALALTVSIAGLIAAATPGAIGSTIDAVRSDVAARPNAALAWMRATEQSPKWQQWRSSAIGTSLDEGVQTVDGVLGSLPDDAIPFFPALLALESLGALTLAWGLYHRISRARLGDPLGALRDFRFNDQLAWGLIAGLVLFLLPTGGAWHGTGMNLMLFFGALYTVRGLGVLVWFLDATHTAVPARVLLAIVASLLSAPAVVGLGLLGLGDTWMDWRNRARGGASSRPTR